MGFTWLAYSPGNYVLTYINPGLDMNTQETRGDAPATVYGPHDGNANR